MKILKTFLLLISSLCIFFLVSCSPDQKAYTDPIKNPVADSLVNNAIERSTALSLSSADQKKAISILKKITNREEFLLATDSLQSLSYHWLGCFYHHLSEPDSALFYIDTAISMRKVGIYHSSNLGLAKSYFNRSRVNYKAGKFEEAILDILSANKLLEKFPKEIELRGKFYLHTGDYYGNINEQDKAKAYFRQAKDLIKPLKKFFG